MNSCRRSALRPTRAMASVAATVAVVALVAAAGACSGGRITLGTSAGVCFRDLPAAEAAVHKGRLVGVRRVSAATLRNRLPQDTTLATLPDQELCVLAFSGTYDPGSVTGANNTITGHFAIVAVATKHPQVVASFVVDKLPTRFRHLH
jgi:hypothetical protein